MNYMSMCAKRRLKNELCPHLGQLCHHLEPVVLLDEILDSLRPSEESSDKNL